MNLLLKRRIYAWLVDVTPFIILWILCEYKIKAWDAIMAIPKAYRTAATPGGNVDALVDIAVTLTLALAISITLGVAWILYRSTALSRTGQTYGKRLLKLRVVDNTTHQPPPFKAALVRTLIPQIAGTLPLPGTGLIPYLAAFKHPQGRGWHETTSNTITVDASSK